MTNDLPSLPPEVLADERVIRHLRELETSEARLQALVGERERLRAAIRGEQQRQRRARTALDATLYSLLLAPTVDDGPETR